ncbi:MAG: zinc-dependent alcohol dehydrogenase family protein [Deltaproteobacteria bacterium]|jgi:NADPH2:quinone reductase|nr:zinc-dependent alcohol dehydrogenase family protein [Deltaproteobacteria bacterium]
MKKMTAYVTRSYGPDAHFEATDVPIPKLAPEQVLIEVKATSLNPIDHKLLRHDIGLNPELPAVLHGDVAGIVSEVGSDVSNFRVGDEVYACAGGFIGNAGALADYMPADSRLVAHKPKTLSFAEAAALPLVVITAWEAMIDSARVKTNDHVLVHAGVGGVGHVAVQIAKSRGARVATTVSTEQAAQTAKKLGADEIINYRQESVEDYVQRLNDGKGFDMVYDTVGGPNFEKSLQALRNYGHVVTVFTGTTATKLELMTSFLKSASIHTQNMSIPLVSGQGRDHHGQILRDAAKLVDSGKLKPLIHEQQFKFQNVNEAHALFESGKYVGKIVLTSN